LLVQKALERLFSLHRVISLSPTAIPFVSIVGVEQSMKTTKEVRTLRQRLAAFGVGALCCVVAYAADAVNIESDMSHHIVEQPGPKR
jgi:hypothetical protein